MRILAILILLFGSHWAFAEEQPLTYNDHGKRDPFWRLVTPSGGILSYGTDFQASDLALEGIIFDPRGKNLAIINGKVVKTNDKIGQFLVLEITEKKVVLSKGQENFVLELKKEE